MRPPQRDAHRPRLQPLHRSLSIHSHRIQRTGKSQVHARRTPQRPVPKTRPRQPTDQRVDHIEAVDIEVDDQVVSRPPLPLIGPPPAEPTRGGGEQAGLDHPERVDEHLPVGESDPGRTAVDRRAGEHRLGERNDERSGRGGSAVGHDRPTHREREA